MTGDDGMEVLDLDMELDEHALRVFQLHSQPWLKARLQFYKEKSDALWRRRRNGSRHRNRVSQMVAEILLRAACAKWGRILTTWSFRARRTSK